MEQKIVRRALKAEILWINAKYQEIGFVVSHFEREFIAIAELESQKAGIGRLVDIDARNQELGGIYVLPEFRKHGLARDIVGFLLQNKRDAAQIFCLPFEHLANFYASFGFRPVSANDHIPDEVRKKHQWCNENKEYKHKTLLYMLP